ncbi:hypothetical protein [Roseospira goensis]|uniref:Rha family transcriptional regulator n=1 Tax=Roseospira goensis TaxID=391922 RepID=A0A7W6S2S6_9PROT|nr:hypothetical protein [Roseospira goensis]MBB4287841.1 hypothetical protein [Roseospira goensis]
MPLDATPLALADLDTSDDEPRILDLRLAERLGYDRPRAIRQIITRHRPELLSYGTLAPRCVAQRRTNGATHTVTEYRLMEPQALLICMFSRTPRAAAIRREVITVFMAWRRGKLVTPARLSAEMNHAVAAIAARDSRIARLEQRETQLLSIVERLSGRA